MVTTTRGLEARIPNLGILANVPDSELSSMKIVVVAAVVFGFAMPAKINTGAK